MFPAKLKSHNLTSGPIDRSIHSSSHHNNNGGGGYTSALYNSSSSFQQQQYSHQHPVSRSQEQQPPLSATGLDPVVPSSHSHQRELIAAGGMGSPPAKEPREVYVAPPRNPAVTSQQFTNFTKSNLHHLSSVTSDPPSSTTAIQFRNRSPPHPEHHSSSSTMPSANGGAPLLGSGKGSITWAGDVRHQTISPPRSSSAAVTTYTGPPIRLPSPSAQTVLHSTDAIRIQEASEAAEIEAKNSIKRMELEHKVKIVQQSVEDLMLARQLDRESEEAEALARSRLAAVTGMSTQTSPTTQDPYTSPSRTKGSRSRAAGAASSISGDNTGVTLGSSSPTSPNEIELIMQRRALERGAVQGDEVFDRRSILAEEDEAMEKLIRHGELLFKLAAKEDHLLQMRLEEAEKRLERHRRRWEQGERHRGEVVEDIYDDIDRSVVNRDIVRSTSPGRSQRRNRTSTSYQTTEVLEATSTTATDIAAAYPRSGNGSILNNRSTAASNTNNNSRSALLLGGLSPIPQMAAPNNTMVSNATAADGYYRNQHQQQEPLTPSSVSGGVFDTATSPTSPKRAETPGAKLNESVDNLAHQVADASLRSMVGGTSAGPSRVVNSSSSSSGRVLPPQQEDDADDASSLPLRRIETAPYQQQGGGGMGNSTSMMSSSSNSRSSRLPDNYYNMNQSRSAEVHGSNQLGAGVGGSVISNRSVRFDMTQEQEEAARQTEEQIRHSLMTSNRRKYKQQLMNESLSRPVGAEGGSSASTPPSFY